MGKWSKFDGKFPQHEKPEHRNPERKEKLLVAVRALRGKPMIAVAQENLDAVEAKREAEAAVKDAELRIEASEWALRDQMKDAQLDSVILAGYRFTPGSEPIAEITDKAAMLAWFQENQPDSVSVHGKIVTSVVKRFLDGEEGETLPDGVDVYMRRTFSRTKQST